MGSRRSSLHCSLPRYMRTHTPTLYAHTHHGTCVNTHTRIHTVFLLVAAVAYTVAFRAPFPGAFLRIVLGAVIFDFGTLTDKIYVHSVCVLCVVCYVCLCICTCVCTYIRMRACVHVCVCMIYAHTYTHMHTCVRTYTRTYARTHNTPNTHNTHTHNTHTRTHTHRDSRVRDSDNNLDHCKQVPPRPRPT